jgi:hypothetical protein
MFNLKTNLEKSRLPREKLDLGDQDRLDPVATFHYCTGDTLAPSVPSTIIKNGTIEGCNSGVLAGPECNTPSPLFLSNIRVDNITFQSGITGVSFNQVNNSLVTGCTFNADYYGITDGSTQTGNTYTGNTFDDNQSHSLEVSSVGPIFLKQCQFQP